MVAVAGTKNSSISYGVASESFLIWEEKKAYVKHDQLFKELINNFFAEFLEVFFPEVHADIDFKSIKPLSEELFTDLLKGENRRVDIVIEAKLKNVDTLIIIHVEPQSTYEKDFHQRMYNYFSLLYNKYRKPILPIAVFSYDENRNQDNQFTIEFPFFHVLTFNFLMLELKKKNWRKYLQSNNPVAAALLSKMGYTKEEKVQVKMEFLRMMVSMELDPASARFINDFFEQYLILDEKEEAELMQEISQQDDPKKFTQLPNSWEERGIRKEKEQVVLEMLKEDLPIDLIAKVTRLDEEAIEEIRKNN